MPVIKRSISSVSGPVILTILIAPVPLGDDSAKTVEGFTVAVSSLWAG